MTPADLRGECGRRAVWRSLARASNESRLEWPARVSFPRLKTGFSLGTKRPTASARTSYPISP